MTNKPISEVIRDMREHADYILELKEEYPNGHDDLIHAYDRADTLFGADNVKRLINHIGALEQQLAAERARRVVNFNIDGDDVDCVRDRTCRSDDYCEGFVDGMLDAQQQIKSQNSRIPVEGE
ncbi:hypothetical protein ACULN0_10975 [Pectobacterium actinidiae]|uniref:hypothetical protein n=1 Tax=Pectobacterium actinidiae TaxID=1507808 RepID=UPI0040407223